MTRTTTGWLLLAAALAILSAGIYLDRFESYSLASKIVRGSAFSLGVGVTAIYLVSVARNWRRWPARDLVGAIGWGLYTFVRTYSNGYWGIWYFLGSPQSWREANIIPLTVETIALLFIFVAMTAEPDGRVLPYSWTFAFSWVAAGIIGAITLAAFLT